MLRVVACSGWATAPFFDFLHGVSNALAQTHLPGAAPYDDTFLGPKGRLADMVRRSALHSSRIDVISSLAADGPHDPACMHAGWTCILGSVRRLLALVGGVHQHISCFYRID